MFSIIIPLYNKADYIAETLKSVLNQTYCDYEVIVVNDSSTDNSLEVASSFQDERIHIYTKENEGVSAARNYGIMRAKYDYIAFLDADDIWESDYLECQKKLIEIYPNAGIYSTAFYSLEKGKRKLRNVLINEHTHFLVHDYFKESVMNGLSICWTSSLCLKKEIIERIPMFRVGIKRGEDLDLWLRIALNYDVAYLNLPKVFYKTRQQHRHGLPQVRLRGPRQFQRLFPGHLPPVLLVIDPGKQRPIAAIGGIDVLHQGEVQIAVRGGGPGRHLAPACVPVGIVHIGLIDRFPRQQSGVDGLGRFAPVPGDLRDLQNAAPVVVILGVHGNGGGAATMAGHQSAQGAHQQHQAQQGQPF